MRCDFFPSLILVLADKTLPLDVLRTYSVASSKLISLLFFVCENAEKEQINKKTTNNGFNLKSIIIVSVF